MWKHSSKAAHHLNKWHSCESKGSSPAQLRGSAAEGGERPAGVPTCGVMVMSLLLSVVPAMVWSSQGSMNTTRPSLVLGTIMPTARRWYQQGGVVNVQPGASMGGAGGRCLTRPQEQVDVSAHFTEGMRTQGLIGLTKSGGSLACTRCCKNAHLAGPGNQPLVVARHTPAGPTVLRRVVVWQRDVDP